LRAGLRKGAPYTADIVSVYQAVFSYFLKNPSDQEYVVMSFASKMAIVSLILCFFYWG